MLSGRSSLVEVSSALVEPKVHGFSCSRVLCPSANELCRLLSSRCRHLFLPPDACLSALPSQENSDLSLRSPESDREAHHVDLEHFEKRRH